MDNSLKALGLMSGTSMDGIDASIIESDGEYNLNIIEEKFVPYSDEFIKRLSNYIDKIEDRDRIFNTKKEYINLEKELTLLHANISSEIIKKSRQNIDLVGFHGQTIIHKPRLGYSIQMGDSYLLSKLLGLKVVSNFRKNDIANGGEGAPLAPIYHQALKKKFKINSPTLFLNIGGISNITFSDQNTFFAKDIGPGNVMIDSYLKKTKNINYDKNGKIAELGKVNMDIINQFIEHDFYNN